MDFPSQSLTADAHDDVGDVAISNVAGHGSFADVQFFCSFLYREQPLVIVRSNPQCVSSKVEAVS
jgi:hypothetical protein